MNHSYRLPVLVLLTLLSTACTRIPAGYVGIKVNQAGSQRGVEDLPTTTGWVAYNPILTNVFEYPTFVQTATWQRTTDLNEEISFNSSEGLVITADISLSYQLDALHVPHFYIKYRSDDLTTFTHGILRNVARDMFNEVGGKHSVEQIYGPGKEKLLHEVRERINKFVAAEGLTIEQFGFIGAPRPPQNVIDALNAKVAATQQAMQAENELRRKEAEAKQAVATAHGEAEARIERARGEAEANIALARSLTPQVMQWKQLMLLSEKWDGAFPQTMVGGDGKGVSMLVQTAAGGK